MGYSQRCYSKKIALAMMIHEDDSFWSVRMAYHHNVHSHDHDPVHNHRPVARLVRPIRYLLIWFESIRPYSGPPVGIGGGNGLRPRTWLF